LALRGVHEQSLHAWGEYKLGHAHYKKHNVKVFNSFGGGIRLPTTGRTFVINLK
jgi:hypothetical protein